ncbi:hypothetical protein BJI46_08005 [Acinetobacter qingfengensis]|uniref:Uncharacterized protein n=1 Tax=Acinetobacter qingfengensis TaxID=1262585 RepID=A0A1E7RF03_9GAMM|nr:hypothetical protein BJI46_08005 [Acinetobacter qingfengensis]
MLITQYFISFLAFYITEVLWTDLVEMDNLLAATVKIFIFQISINLIFMHIFLQDLYKKLISPIK